MSIASRALGINAYIACFTVIYYRTHMPRSIDIIKYVDTIRLFEQIQWKILH